MTDQTDTPIEEVIARSSVGAAAWCTNCRHTDINHTSRGCFGGLECECSGFVAMTVEEWLGWRYPKEYPRLS